MRRAVPPGMGLKWHRGWERDEGTSLGRVLFTQVLSRRPAGSGHNAHTNAHILPHTNVHPTLVGAERAGKHAQLLVCPLSNLLLWTFREGLGDSPGNARTLPDQVGGGEKLWEPEGASGRSSHFPKSLCLPDSQSYPSRVLELPAHPRSARQTS